MFVLYDYNSNYIPAEHICSHKTKKYIHAFKHCYQEFKNCGFIAHLLQLDNKISAEIIDILRDEKLDIQMDRKVLLSGYVPAYEDIGDTLGIMLPFIVTGDSRTQTSPVLIFMKKDLIVTIHDDYGGKITKLYKVLQN